VVFGSNDLKWSSTGTVKSVDSHNELRSARSPIEFYLLHGFDKGEISMTGSAPRSSDCLYYRLIIALLLETIAISASCAPRNGAFLLRSVGEGDYVHFGQISVTNPDNVGDIANLGVIIGRDAVAVVDTGGSVQVGIALRAAIREVTGKPIRYVINTHEHPDHVFGNAAFQGDTIFVGHRNLPAELQKRGGFYLHSFRDALGSAAIGQVSIIQPTLLVANETILDLGEKRLRLTAWSPAAHTDCDLTVLDETTGVLFAGDLVFLDHVPVLDGGLAGWLSVLPRLAALPARIVVPGHGQRTATWPQALDDERRYLTVLADDTRRLIAEGVPMAQAVPQIAQSERGNWALFDDYNPRNATAAFSELEWE
jgi:quinoprotein relay system zinc metallohydrolase 2